MANCSKPPRLVLLGKQGAGKGTQAKRLADHYATVHLSTGDMFRAQAAQGTAFGLEARRYMDAGDLVPDEIVMGVIEECLAPGGPLGDGFVLDGFPRTVPQAVDLARVLGARPLDLVIDLEVPREIVLDRIAGRRVCVNCQTVYHVNMPPSHNWTCDKCGGEVRQRDDDTEEAVERRLQLYERETVPIMDYYREQGLLVVVDGVGEGDEVFERLTKVVDDRVSA
jgi:adenylate kinase